MVWKVSATYHIKISLAYGLYVTGTPEKTLCSVKRIHDLRRTLSTHLSDLGVEFYVVEQLLGHALPGVAGVYNRSKFMAKKLDALELWTTYLNSIAGADSKVIILKQKAG